MSSSSDFLSRAYALKDANDASTFYDEWAAKYDSDMVDLGYLLPKIVAEAVPQYGDIKGAILDAGCGTGLVGQELMKLGASTIDGLDISPGMLELAKKTGAYRSLEITDLTKKLPLDNDSYATVVCSGTLTHGHVGPSALAEFTRVTRSGGLISTSIIDDIWEAQGYKAEVERLASEGKLATISTDKVEFRKQRSAYVRLVLLQKL